MDVWAKLRESTGKSLDFFGTWPVAVVLAFFGAMFWAKAKDPFKRVEFKLKTSAGGIVRGMAVMPRPVGPMPVVIFLHDAGGSVLQSGVELRQMAEMGLAVVDMDYDSTGRQNFAAQFQALLEYVQRQPWAMTNAVAWVGAGLGGERMLSFLAARRDAKPQLLVGLGSGWVSELDSFLGTVRATNGFHLRCPVLLVHGKSDSKTSLASVERLNAFFKTNGIHVEMKLIRGKGHDFEQDRTLLFRVIGESCLSTLSPDARWSGFGTHRDLGHPFILFLTPAILWVIGRYYLKRRKLRDTLRQISEPVTRFERILRWTAIILAVLAISQTAIHLGIPRLPTNERTLYAARRFLIRAAWKKDFEELAANPIWRGKSLRILIEHVELANYIQELMYKDWRFENLDPNLYSSYVLSPIIDSAPHQELSWRRMLWESFYPRIRKERTTMSSAQIVVRHLRERVSIDPREPTPAGIESIWNNQVTNEAGFEWIYVAALRSVGIPARLNSLRQAELWTGGEWMTAPRPLVTYWDVQRQLARLR